MTGDDSDAGRAQVVFRHASQAACSDRALVLTSLEIPWQILEANAEFALVTPIDFAERAKYELWQYDEENRPPAPPPPPVAVTYHDATPGIIFYIGTLGLFAWLAGEAAFGRDWLAAGRIDGVRLRAGELWRPVTALTLHLDLKHLLGNMGFGALFGFFAGRLVGNGVGWLTIILSSALANCLNTLLLDASHRSIGASTAVFAALGLTAGFVWRGKLMAQDRWPYRVGPIVGGVALLAFTGTGSENTDVGAHLTGFACGFLAGMLLVYAAPILARAKVQFVSAVAAIVLLVGSWFIALA